MIKQINLPHKTKKLTILTLSPPWPLLWSLCQTLWTVFTRRSATNWVGNGPGQFLESYEANLSLSALHSRVKWLSWVFTTQSNKIPESLSRMVLGTTCAFGGWHDKFLTWQVVTCQVCGRDRPQDQTQVLTRGTWQVIGQVPLDPQTQVYDSR